MQKVHLCSCGKEVEYKIGVKIFPFLIVERYVCSSCLKWKITYGSIVKWYEELYKPGQIEPPVLPKWDKVEER